MAEVRPAGRTTRTEDAVETRAISPAPNLYAPEPLEFERVEYGEALHRSREFLELMARRRSVRAFSDEPVPPELIENAIRTAGTAPSGANQQPWTFVAVTDPALKARLRAAAEHE